MSRIYSKPFTSNCRFLIVFFLIAIIIFNNSAYSADLSQSYATDNSKIVGHYYVAKDKDYTKYTDKVQWEVTSIPEWTKFLVNLKTMPQDLEKNNPMGLRQPEVIHFNVSNSDRKSGHDIFISKAGIQQFSRMPMDYYYDALPDFREFLESELALNPGYDAASVDININEPGIVVIFRGSNQLSNPHWTIKLSDKIIMDRYKGYINTMRQDAANKKMVVDMKDDTIFDEQGSFILYLNYPDAPQQFLTVSASGRIRGTRIEQRYYYYKDSIGYFSMFKRQAEDNLRASEIIQDAPDERRKREAQSGTLF